MLFQISSLGVMQEVLTASQYLGDAVLWVSVQVAVLPARKDYRQT